MATPTGFVQPFSTGASYVYAGLAGGKAQSPTFLGTCEGFPKHERRPDYLSLMNDVSGRKKPLDMSFQGLDATISLVMSVWDEGGAQCFEQYVDFTGASGLASPGSYRFNDVGSLMGLEGFAVPIWIAYGYAGLGGFPKAAYSALPSGYHYFRCIPFSPNTTDEGAQGMMRHLMFYTWAAANFKTQTFSLYDYNMAGLPAPTNGPTVA